MQPIVMPARQLEVRQRAVDACGSQRARAIDGETDARVFQSSVVVLRYATVLEENGVVSLYIKTIERAHLPAKLWERIKLSTNYSQALAQITEQLQFWPNFNVHKCKQRLTKIHQYLIRMRKLKLKTRVKLVGAPKKVERREAVREKKAEKAARLDDAITKELVQRLNAGVYQEMVYFPEQAYSKVLDLVGQTEEDQVDEELGEEVEGEQEEELEGAEMEGGEDDEDMEEGEEGEDFDDDEVPEYEVGSDSDEDDEVNLAEIAEAFRGEPMDDGEERFGEAGDDEEEPRAPAAAAAGKGKKRAGAAAAAASSSAAASADDDEDGAAAPPSKRKKPAAAAAASAKKKPARKGRAHMNIEMEEEREMERER